MSDLVDRARLIQRVNAHWYDSICECEECTEERFGLITPMADEIERLRGLLDRVETLAVNDRTGCRTCTSVVNLVVGAAMPPDKSGASK